MLIDGKSPTVTVKRGETNRIVVSVAVTHTDLLGPDPPDNPVVAKHFKGGWPFTTRYNYGWDVEVDEKGEIAILSDPKENKVVEKSRDGVTTEVTLDFEKSNARYLALHVHSKYVGKRLSLDAPWVEGEGPMVGLGGIQMRALR